MNIQLDFMEAFVAAASEVLMLGQYGDFFTQSGDEP
jgi:hypothetical protein